MSAAKKIAPPEAKRDGPSNAGAKAEPPEQPAAANERRKVYDAAQQEIKAHEQERAAEAAAIHTKHTWSAICRWTQATHPEHAQAKDSKLTLPIIGIPRSAIAEWEKNLAKLGYETKSTEYHFTVSLPGVASA